MVAHIQPTTASAVSYPDSDGQLMADNTKQFRWIVMIKEGLEWLFQNRPDVFVAGDLLWYPIEGDNTVRTASDVLVVFGRPKGDRGSYQQWLEDNIPPQVVFEILSPGNRLTQMNQKLEFYETYGVEEYYLYDPERQDLSGWQQLQNRLRVIDPIEGWISPRLQVRFELTSEGLELYRPDGQKFETYTEVAQQREQQQHRAEQLAAQLRAMGVEPDV
jgi:Uma2 family endonuclease